MANNKVKYFIITGDPGVGKTTLIKKLCVLVQKCGVQPSGFYTEEVRKERTRMGFDVISLEGERGRLARDQSLLTNPVSHNVGKYGVLVPEFESIALHCIRKILYGNRAPTKNPILQLIENTLDPATSPSLLVIDEIGKMEFFSVPFKSMVRGIFSTGSDSFVLATIPVRRGDQLIESIRNNKQGKVWTVTKENRDHIEEDIMKELNFSLVRTVGGHDVGKIPVGSSLVAAGGNSELGIVLTDSSLSSRLTGVAMCKKVIKLLFYC